MDVSQHLGTPRNRTRTLSTIYEECEKSEVQPQTGETEVGRTATDAIDKAEVENVAFSDQDAGWKSTITSMPDSTYDDVATADTSLGSFLSRPVLIHQGFWGVGLQFNHSMNPWQAFFTDPAVTDKIANYELLRAKLKLKIVISGTGFHYGRCLVSYNPLFTDDQFEPEGNYSFLDMIKLSQRQHVFLNPAQNEGGELELPFMWPKNYLSISNSEWSQMGEFTIKSFNVLKHANGGDDDVTITTYAWAEDVSLAMPTSQTPSAVLRNSVVPQNGKKKHKKKSGAINSGDEYGQGIISKPASIVANIAGRLASAPVIGPYARATEMAAGAAGNIASMFGYSRPAVLAPAMPYKPTVCGNLANTSGEDSVFRLSMDPKQEITVDPRTAGLGCDDELDLVSLATRESYLTSFDWTPSNPAQGILWNIQVSPVNYISTGGEYHLTPSALVSTHFDHWKGSMKYRFQIVKSNFHKGRLAIRYDPIANGPNLDFNTSYYRVVDIAETDDFEVIVGWGQSAPMRSMFAFSDTQQPFSTSRLPAATLPTMNGILEVDVLNALVSPSADASISINVFVSCCDDIKFGQPSATRLSQFSLFPPHTPNRSIDAQKAAVSPQSGEDYSGSGETHGPDTIQVIAQEGDPSDEFFHVFMGERITSIREILKRYYMEKTWVAPRMSTEMQVWRKDFKDMHLRRGWDLTNGLDRSEKDNSKLNVAGPSPITVWTACFAGWRGALRKKFMMEGSTSGRLLMVSRFGSGAVFSGRTGLASFDSDELGKFITSKRGGYVTAGACATITEQNNVLEVEFPYYNFRRFLNPRSKSPECSTHRVEFLVSGLEGDNFSTDKGVILTTFTSVGEDFTLLGFTGVPTLFRYDLDHTS